MKTLTITAYSFDELSDKAKEKARQWMRRCVGDDYGWADFVTEDAENVGLKITGWNLDRGASCGLEFTETAERVSELILEGHGEGCDTRKAASDYRMAMNMLRTKVESGNMNEEDERDADSQAKAEFKNALEACYLQMLRDEWEHRMSDEAIDADIEASDYLFTAEGKRSITLND